MTDFEERESAAWFMGTGYYDVLQTLMGLCIESYIAKDVREYWHNVYSLFMHVYPQLEQKDKKAMKENAEAFENRLYDSQKGDRVSDLYSDDTGDLDLFRRQLHEANNFYMALLDLMNDKKMLIPKHVSHDPGRASLRINNA